MGLLDKENSNAMALYLCRNTRCIALAFLGSVFINLASFSPAAAETRTFVFKWFYPAVYTQPDNCPEGINPLSTGIMRNALALIGKTPEESSVIVEDVVAGGRSSLGSREQLTHRGTFEGQAVNAYLNPLTAPDPKLKLAVGRYAYGFNLDGKGAGSSSAFEDPETRERGVDNGYFRVIGCMENHQAHPGGTPNYPLSTWDTLRETMAAWLLTIDGDNLSRDGKVTVTIERSLNTVMRDAHGDVMVDQTFQVDPDPRSRTVLSGSIKEGALRVSAPEMYMLGDQFMGYELDFVQARLRLNLKPDLSAEGILGGYMKWMPLYVQHAGAGLVTESMRGVDVVGLYYAYKNTADFDPDPVTGQNTRISAAWRVELVPAFIVPADRSYGSHAQADPLIRTPQAH